MSSSDQQQPQRPPEGERAPNPYAAARNALIRNATAVGRNAAPTGNSTTGNDASRQRYAKSPRRYFQRLSRNRCCQPNAVATHRQTLQQTPPSGMVTLCADRALRGLWLLRVFRSVFRPMERPDASLRATANARLGYEQRHAHAGHQAGNEPHYLRKGLRICRRRERPFGVFR